MAHIRISVHGALYAAVGILLLASGILSGALFSAVCGALLMLYMVYAFTAVVITAVLWKNTEPEIEVIGGKDGITYRTQRDVRFSPTDQPIAHRQYMQSAHIRTAHPNVLPAQAAKTQTVPKDFPPCIPGTTVFYTIEFSLSPHRSAQTACTLSIPVHGAHAQGTDLQGRQQDVEWKGRIRRGRYFYKKQYIRIEDFAGFFAVLSIRQAALQQTYTVVQPVLPFKTVQHLKLGSCTDTDELYDRTHELYESRPYFPGDDPRKIHWKLYAHTQDLAIKLGTFEPPPVRNVNVYIEEPLCMEKKDIIPLTTAFDAFIGRLSGLLVTLLEHGIRCTLLLYDYPQNVSEAASIEKKSLQRYEIPMHAEAAEILQLLAIPAPCFSMKDLPALHEVLSTVPEGSALLYCYLPQTRNVNAKGRADGAHTPCGAPSYASGAFSDTLSATAVSVYGAAPYTSGAPYSSEAPYAAIEEKMAACSANNVETLFYLAAPPVPERDAAGTAFEHPQAALQTAQMQYEHEAPIHERTRSTHGHTQPVSGERSSLFKKLMRSISLRRFLYAPPLSAREEAFYTALEKAAERDIHILTAKGYHADFL